MKKKNMKLIMGDYEMKYPMNIEMLKEWCTEHHIKYYVRTMFDGLFTEIVLCVGRRYVSISLDDVITMQYHVLIRYVQYMFYSYHQIEIK
jgi:hypothetical protein